MVAAACLSSVAESAHMRYPLLLLLMAVLAPRALACTCAGVMTPQEKIDYAQVIFAGRVVAIENPGQAALDKLPDAERQAAWEKAVDISHQEGWGPTWGRKVTFEVSNVFKGTQSRLIELWTGQGGGDCGIDVAEGVTYLVFAHWSRAGRISAGMCTGTLPLACGRAELLALGEPESLTFPEEREPLDPHDYPCLKWPERASGPSLLGIVPSGLVPANLVIDREGRVVELQLKHPNARRMREVAHIVRNWCFQPAKLNDKPVAVRLDQIWVREVNE